MRRLYVCQTRLGPFYIVLHEGQYHAVYNGDEFLGAYSSPQHAVDDLAGGHTFSITGGTDTATLGIPEELEEWERL